MPRKLVPHHFLGACLVIALLVFGGSLAAQRLVLSFEEDMVGALPDGFFFTTNRQNSPGTWQVVGSAKGRHLSHVADPTVTLRGISVAAFSYAAPANVKVATRIKLTEGDRAGGLIWRYKDPNNFYFMAIFLGNHTAGIFRVTEGNRIRLHEVDGIDLDESLWHSMWVVHDGEDIRGSIDGIAVLRARDRGLTEGGRAGVWSAGNTTSWFDDVIIQQAPD